MSTIQSSLMPYYSSGVSASQLSVNQLLSSQLGLQQNQDTNTNDLFSGAYSLSLSNAALSMFGGGDAGSDSASGILDALTYSNFSTGSEGSDNGIDSLFSSLAGLGSGSEAPIVPTSTSGPSFEAATVADGGPLPAFLAYVDKQMNLSSTQQQALQNIANENMDIPGDTPAVVQQIATELQQAGIPETI